MPTSVDPRVVVRLSAADKALLDGIAAGVGVSTAALIREGALRAAVDVAREVRAGRLVLRARNGVGRGPASAAVPAVGEDRAAVFRRLTGNG